MSYIPLFEKLSTIINTTNTGSSLIGTPTKDFVVFQINETLNNVSSLVSLQTRSIGSNASSYNNLVTSSLVTNLAVVKDINSPSLSTSKGFVSGGTGIYYNVTIGSVASNCNVQVDIIGYYQ